MSQMEESKPPAEVIIATALLLNGSAAAGPYGKIRIFEAKISGEEIEYLELAGDDDE